MLEERRLPHEWMVARGSQALVIDPDAAAARVLGNSLKRLGFSVHLVSRWSEAMPRWTQPGIDWVFCDVAKLNDLDVIRDMLCRYPNRRLVALIRGGRVEHLARALLALERGAHEFLIKPAHIEAVAGVVISLRR